MTSTNGRPAVAGHGASLGMRIVLGTRIAPLNSKSDLIAQWAWVLDRLDVIERLSKLKLDLQARIWREQQIFMLVDVDRDFGPLTTEVEDFTRLSRAIAWPKGGVR